MSKELPLQGSWHGAAVTEGVRRALRARCQNLCEISNILIDCPRQKPAVRRKSISVFYTIYTPHTFTALFFCVIL